MNVIIGEKAGYNHFSDSSEPPIPHIRSNLHALFGNVSHAIGPEIGIFDLSSDKTRDGFYLFGWKW